MKFTKKICN